MTEQFEKPIVEGRRFRNPASFVGGQGFPSFSEFRRWMFEKNNFSLPSTKVLDDVLPIRVPNFKSGAKLAYTWLGHATVVVQMGNVSFITDPIFARKASPFYVGFARYRPLPCRIEQLPEIHFGMISHNHYDHLDKHAVRVLNNRFKDMQWYVPLGLKEFMVSQGAKQSNVFEMNWGDSKTACFNENQFVIYCVPAQHWSQRGIFDRCRTLWSGWVVQGSSKKFYFAGDTGFCEKEFEKIGNILGPLDLAAIPIGAYEPRYVMARQHVNPEEAVKIHQLVRSKKTFAIHWGTYNMGSNEGYLEPKESLKKEAEKANLKIDEFLTCFIGETWTEP